MELRFKAAMRIVLMVLSPVKVARFNGAGGLYCFATTKGAAETMLR